MRLAGRVVGSTTSVTAALLLAACGGTSAGNESPAAPSAEVTVTNCAAQETFPSPAQRIYVNDGNMTSMLLSLGAQEQISTVVGLERHTQALTMVYGQDVVDALPAVPRDSISLEHVIAREPDVVVAGWNYGYAEDINLTPATLRGHDIAAYVLSESCRQDDGARGTMPPWEALEADITNLGEITGRQDRATAVVADIEERRSLLQQAPQAQEKPTVFLFDSARKDVLTSGAFGGPQAIIEAAGATNATSDVTLPYAAWTSSPLNIDAAEELRKGLEEHDLVPASDIEPKHDLHSLEPWGR